MADIADRGRGAKGPLRAAAVLAGRMAEILLRPVRAALAATGNTVAYVAAATGLSRIRAGYRRFARTLGGAMPKGIYQRSLIIIIAPIVLLQAVVAFVFMERHWQSVTQHLSAATTRDIAAVVDL